MKTASTHLKAKSGITADAKTNSVSEQGPEDGRDQNIKPSSHSYEPSHKTQGKVPNHNAEVYREGDAINTYGRPEQES